jgi:hypothetical protein
VFSNILCLDAVAGKLTPLASLPEETAQWVQLPILSPTNSSTLVLKIPHTDGTYGVLPIDTGCAFGLALPDQKWKPWRDSHPKAPTSIQTYDTPSDGFYVARETWAHRIPVGPVTLTDLPVIQAGPAGEKMWGSQYEGTLGLAALKRLDIIIDGRNNLAYLRPKMTSPPGYRHNRLGAVFVPAAGHLHQGIARVVDGGPAYNAGVRDGDVLMKVNQVTVRAWTADWLNQFFLPAGTKLNLTLERDGKTYSTTATLREILKPSSEQNE